MPEIIFKQVHEMLSARHTHHTGKSLTYKKWRKIIQLQTLSFAWLICDQIIIYILQKSAYNFINSKGTDGKLSFL